MSVLSETQKEMLDPFYALMQREMIANSDKGDMASDWDATSYQLIAETAYHLAKLNKAMLEVERGGDDAARQQVDEFSADVANYMAKTAQRFGSLEDPI